MERQKHSDLPFHHHFHNRGMQLSSNKGEVEHLYLNSEAVKSLPVGTGLGRERREVGQEEVLTLTQTLSKNVTRILEELLMDYDQTERPPSKGKILHQPLSI